MTRTGRVSCNTLSAAVACRAASHIQPSTAQTVHTLSKTAVQLQPTRLDMGCECLNVRVGAVDGEAELEVGHPGLQVVDAGLEQDAEHHLRPEV